MSSPELDTGNFQRKFSASFLSLGPCVCPAQKWIPALFTRNCKIARFISFSRAVRMLYERNRYRRYSPEISLFISIWVVVPTSCTKINTSIFRREFPALFPPRGSCECRAQELDTSTFHRKFPDLFRKCSVNIPEVCSKI